MTIRRKGEKVKYDFVDAGCLGRTCFAPGMFQHRSPLSGGGSRNTGSPDSPCCLNRAYRGCPSGPLGESTEQCTLCSEEGTVETAPAGAGHSDDLAEHAPCPWCGGTKKVTVSGLPIVDAELRKKRRAEGWKVA